MRSCVVKSMFSFKWKVCFEIYWTRERKIFLIVDQVGCSLKYGIWVSKFEKSDSVEKSHFGKFQHFFIATDVTDQFRKSYLDRCVAINFFIDFSYLWNLNFWGNFYLISFFFQLPLISNYLAWIFRTFINCKYFLCRAWFS